MLLGLLLAVLVAHGGTAVQESGHRPVLDRLSPEVAGIEVRLVDAATRIELDAGDHEVVVLGYEQEPFLLVDEGGVYENRLSPSTYLNRSLDGEVPPPEASFRSEPDWVKIDDGRVARWHDHALHVPPGQAIGARDESRWRVPIRVDGERVDIEGRLLTLPTPSIVPHLALAAVAAVATFLARRLVPALVVLLAADVTRVVGLSLATPTWLASRWEVIAEQWHLQAVGWGLAIAAFVLHARRRRWEALAATFVAAATITVGGGLLELDDLGAPALEASTRWVIAVVLGVGIGATVRAGLALRRATFRPASP